jgi:hypothetical protein
MVVNEGQVGEAVRRDSPWWRGYNWDAEDRDLRNVKASGISYDPRPLTDLADHGLYMLYGPRRVGKTVSVKRAIEALLAQGVKPLQIIRVTVDGWPPSRLRMLYDHVVRVQTSSVGDATRYWFIDEITACKGDWWSVIKNLRDNTAFGADCVVLTGSSNAGLDEAIKALAGRRGHATNPDRVLLPMDFRAFCSCLGIDLPSVQGVRADELRSSESRDLWLSLIPYTEDLVGAWAAYLESGGYPQAVADWRRGNAVSPSTIQAVWDVVRGDALTTGMTEAELGGVLDGMATRLASLVNMSDFAREAGIGVVSLDTRMRSLISAFLAWRCPRADAKGVPDPGKQGKLYFLDPLIARLPHLVHGRPPIDITRMSEQQLGVALLEWNETVRSGSVRSAQWVTHHRGSKSNEIDFAGRCADTRVRAVPVEGKYVSGGWRQEALVIANSTLGEGILATRDITDVTLGEPVWAVPAPFVALALNSYRR